MKLVHSEQWAVMNSFFLFVDGRPRAAEVGWAGLLNPGAAVHRLSRFQRSSWVLLLWEPLRHTELHQEILLSWEPFPHVAGQHWLGRQHSGSLCKRWLQKSDRHQVSTAEQHAVFRRNLRIRVSVTWPDFIQAHLNWFINIYIDLADFKNTITSCCVHFSLWNMRLTLQMITNVIDNSRLWSSLF